MAHLIPVGEGLGIQIPPDLLKAAHLDNTSDLFFEVTMQGLLIKSIEPAFGKNSEKKGSIERLFSLGKGYTEGTIDVDQSIMNAVRLDD